MTDVAEIARGLTKAQREAGMNNHCDECRHWCRGYRLQGFRVPSFCNKHFHSQAGDDPACAQFEEIEHWEAIKRGDA